MAQDMTVEQELEQTLVKAQALAAKLADSEVVNLTESFCSEIRAKLPKPRGVRVVRSTIAAKSPSSSNENAKPPSTSDESTKPGGASDDLHRVQQTLSVIPQDQRGDFLSALESKAKVVASGQWYTPEFLEGLEAPHNYMEEVEFPYVSPPEAELQFLGDDSTEEGRQEQEEEGEGSAVSDGPAQANPADEVGSFSDEGGTSEKEFGLDDLQVGDEGDTGERGTGENGTNESNKKARIESDGSGKAKAKKEEVVQEASGVFDRTANYTHRTLRYPHKVQLGNYAGLAPMPKAKSVSIQMSSGRHSTGTVC